MHLIVVPSDVVKIIGRGGMKGSIERIKARITDGRRRKARLKILIKVFAGFEIGKVC